MADAAEPQTTCSNTKKRRTIPQIELPAPRGFIEERAVAQARLRLNAQAPKRADTHIDQGLRRRRASSSATARSAVSRMA